MNNNYLDLIFGTYETQLRAITVNNENIKKFEKRNPETLRSIVYIHEYFHWLQLNSSSIGHLISSIPNLHDRTVTFAMEAPKMFNSMSLTAILTPQFSVC